jgi:ABC-type dipeptide/oligopeptide/nickel transport system permease component
VFQYLLKQAGASVFVLWVVVTLTFFLIQSAPGTLSIIADPNFDPQVAAIIEERLGLDQPCGASTSAGWATSSVATSATRSSTAGAWSR